MKVSHRSAVDPFLVMDVVSSAARLEAEGRRVIHMEIGQPGTPAPKVARAALAHAMERDALGYSVSLGLPSLKNKIAGLYAQRHGLDINPDRIVVTAGASGAFVLAFTALFDAGDRVALGVPGYPSYRQILKALSLSPVDILTTLETRYQPQSIPKGVHGLILASPGNPSGTMLDRERLSDLVGQANAIGASVVSDEIYHGLSYVGREVSALEVSEDLYVVNSFSKYFSMTGWRLGWMVVPEDHIRTVERLAQNMFICAPHASQIAGLAAFDAIPELEANVAVYARNRQLMLETLPRIGFDRIAPPDGAFYVYADVSELTDDSKALAADILEKAGVALTPGHDFDPGRGAGTLRFSYAGATGEIEEGLEKLTEYMNLR